VRGLSRRTFSARTSGFATFLSVPVRTPEVFDEELLAEGAEAVPAGAGLGDPGPRSAS
jgi:hypothetical protein